MDTEERKAFERFMRKETGHSLFRTKYPMTERKDQQYADHTTNMAWIAFQAGAQFGIRIKGKTE